MRNRWKFLLLFWLGLRKFLVSDSQILFVKVFIYTTLLLYFGTGLYKAQNKIHDPLQIHSLALRIDLNFKKYFQLAEDVQILFVAPNAMYSQDYT